MSVAAAQENTTMSYSVNTTLALVIMAGATISIIDALLELEVLTLELNVIVTEDALDWLDDD